MKTVLMVVNILLGLALLVVNFQPYTQTPQNTEGLILGLVAIIFAIAFRMGKRWAEFALPITPLVLSVYVFFGAKELGGLVAGPMILFALIFSAFFILESSYLIFRKRI